jgi:long-subunit fatty acid transport protein
LGSSGQSVGAVQVTYRLNPRVELLGAIRRNRWSGAYAVVVANGPPQQWNNMFNVDWNGFLNGVPNPGYSATSTDLALGARYRLDEKWTLGTGLVYLGKASTRNPSERGQSNSALVNTVLADYAFNENLTLTVSAGMVHYRKKGLSPLSMPSNSTINNIDSRTTKAGNWLAVGAKYTF